MALARVTEHPTVLVLPHTGTVAVDVGCDTSPVISFRTEQHFDCWLANLAAQRGMSLSGPVDDGMVAAEALVRGQQVKAAGEWGTFVDRGVVDDGTLFFEDDDGNTLSYPAAPGERFPLRWVPPFSTEFDELESRAADQYETERRGA